MIQIFGQRPAGFTALRYFKTFSLDLLKKEKNALHLRSCFENEERTQKS
jgi:hypothetical protein